MWPYSLIEMCDCGTAASHRSYLHINLLVTLVLLEACSLLEMHGCDTAAICHSYLRACVLFSEACSLLKMLKMHGCGTAAICHSYLRTCVLFNEACSLLEMHSCGTAATSYTGLVRTIYIRCIYGIFVVFWAGKSPNIWSYTLYI